MDELERNDFLKQTINHIFYLKDLINQEIEKDKDKNINNYLLTYLDCYIVFLATKFFNTSNDMRYFKYIYNNFYNTLLLFCALSYTQKDVDYHIINSIFFENSLNEDIERKINDKLINYSTSYKEELSKGNYFIFLYNYFDGIPCINNLFEGDLGKHFTSLYMHYHFAKFIESKFLKNIILETRISTKDQSFERKLFLNSCVIKDKFKYSKRIKFKDFDGTLKNQILNFYYNADFNSMVLDTRIKLDLVKEEFYKFKYGELFFPMNDKFLKFFELDDIIFENLMPYEFLVVLFGILNEIIFIKSIFNKNIKKYKERIALASSLLKEKSENDYECDFDRYYRIYEKKCGGNLTEDDFVDGLFKSILTVIFDKPITIEDLLIDELNDNFDMFDGDKLQNVYFKTKELTSNFIFSLTTPENIIRNLIFSNLNFVDGLISEFATKFIEQDYVDVLHFNILYLKEYLSSLDSLIHLINSTIIEEK